MVMLSSLATAQIENSWILINDYDPNKVIPGGTVDVSFMVYKPAGVEIEGVLRPFIGYYEGNNFVIVNDFNAPGTSELISWGMEENQKSFILPLKLLDNAPVGMSMYLGVGLEMECSYRLIDVDNDNRITKNNDNIVITIGGQDFNKQITDVREYASGTQYYIASGNYVWTAGPVLRIRAYSIAQILEPPSESWLTIVTIGVGVCAVIVIGIILILRRRRR